MKVKRESEVAQSCQIVSDPMDCSPPGSSIHGIFQARVVEWVAIAFSELGVGRRITTANIYGVLYASHCAKNIGKFIDSSQQPFVVGSFGG